MIAMVIALALMVFVYCLCGVVAWETLIGPPQMRWSATDKVIALIFLPVRPVYRFLDAWGEDK